MKAPGFARVAPAATIAMTGEEATLPIWAIMPAARSGLGGRLTNRTVNTSTSAPAATSTIATHVFGSLGLGEAAALPITNAARTPITSVTPSAPQ